MKKQNGFTLIELVVVIIILGILAVTAAPKFINLQSDARKSTLQGMKGTIQAANSLVFAKAALVGKEKSGNTTVDINDTTVTTDDVAISYGYLQATETAFERALEAEFDAKADPQTGTADWIIEESGTPGTDGQVVIYQRDAPNDSSTCQLTYVEATSTKLPTYTIVDSGC